MHDDRTPRPLNDGRSVALAMALAKAFLAAVPKPHLTSGVSQHGYGPASFDVGLRDEDGTPNGRFAKVTIEIVRDPDRAEALKREIAEGMFR